MELVTTSERLFAKFCEDLGYLCEKIPADPVSGTKTADFRVTKNHKLICIAEVKELSPNADDKRQYRELKKSGFTEGGGEIAARARALIRKASDQLKRDAELGPKIIVLYNNVRINDQRIGWDTQHLDQYEIGAAMFGDLVVSVRLDGGISDKADRAGGGRATTEKEKRYLSAVAVLKDDGSVLFYHNCFASRPLSEKVFQGPSIVHLTKDTPIQSPWEWRRVIQ